LPDHINSSLSSVVTVCLARMRSGVVSIASGSRRWLRGWKRGFQFDCHGSDEGGCCLGLDTGVGLVLHPSRFDWTRRNFCWYFCAARTHSIQKSGGVEMPLMIEVYSPGTNPRPNFLRTSLLLRSYPASLANRSNLLMYSSRFPFSMTRVSKSPMAFCSLMVSQKAVSKAFLRCPLGIHLLGLLCLQSSVLTIVLAWLPIHVLYPL
jgi:hypothetical protein